MSRTLDEVVTDWGREFLRLTGLDEGKATEIEAAPIDRATETQTRVTELKAELDALDGEMLRFKKLNRVTTDRFGRLLGVLCADIGGRAAIDAQWRALLKRRDGLVSAWHKALFAWSEAKNEKQS